MPARFRLRLLRARARLEVKVKRRLASRSRRTTRPITEEVDTSPGPAAGRHGIIRPDQFRTSASRSAIPEHARQEADVQAIQTYSDGDVVRWIGAADSDEPAPVVTLGAAEGEHGASDSHGGEEESAAGEQRASGVTAEEVDDNGASQGLGDRRALSSGGLGLVAGGTSLVRSRKS